jgi:hypothetical protein
MPPERLGRIGQGEGAGPRLSWVFLSGNRCLAAPLEVVGKKWEEGVSVSPARGSGRKEQ